MVVRWPAGSVECFASAEAAGIAILAGLGDFVGVRNNVRVVIDFLFFIFSAIPFDR